MSRQLLQTLAALRVGETNAAGGVCPHAFRIQNPVLAD